jgi:hypothetical protein
MYDDGTSGHARSGQVSVRALCAYISRLVVSAHCATSGAQSWNRKCNANSAPFVGSLPTQSGLNILGSAVNWSSRLAPIFGTTAARKTKSSKTAPLQTSTKRGRRRTSAGAQKQMNSRLEIWSAGTLRRHRNPRLRKIEPTDIFLKGFQQILRLYFVRLKR